MSSQAQASFAVYALIQQFRSRVANALALVGKSENNPLLAAPLTLTSFANPQLVQMQIWFMFLAALLLQVDIESNTTSWDSAIFEYLLVR